MPASAQGLRLLAAAKGGNAEAVKRELSAADPEELAGLRDAAGATPLHLAALGAHEDAVEALLDCGAPAEAWLAARELNAGGSLPLHCAVKSGVPMVAYQLASKQPAACLEPDGKQRTPIQLAVAADKGEVLNAMLLACAGHATATSLAATRKLLAAGAVPDTWAPSGSSSLMLAASVDCAEGVALLLDHGASLELQDALGRTALMFAAGNNAQAVLEVLLDRGGSVSIRDRRGRNVMDYAAEGSEVQRVLKERIAEMESRAARLQEELLAELLEDEASGAPAKEQRPGKKGKKKKGKGGGKGKAEPEPAAQPPAADGAPAAEPEAAGSSEPAVAAQALQREQEQPGGKPSAAPTEDVPAAEGEEAVEDGPSERPASPDWQVVGKPSRQQRSGHHPGQPHHHTLHQRLPDGGPHMRRCPSASSLGSSSSGDSHETAGASSVGSQRSVLVHPSRPSSAAGRPVATKSAASKPVVIVAAPPPAKPAWGKPAVAPAGPPAAAAAQPVQQPDAQSATQQPEQQQQQPEQQPGGTLPAPPAAPACVPAGLPLAEAQDATALAAEVASLRAQLAQVQLERQGAEERHQADLAAVVAEAAAHEAAAVIEAAAAERTRCIYRFAAFLQNSNLAPELLARFGLTGAAAGFAGAGVSGPAALPPFLPSGPQAGLLRLGKAAPVPVPAAPAPLLPGDLSAVSSLSPLSASPTFSYTALEQRLRDEFSGDVSRFLQPAAAELG